MKMKILLIIPSYNEEENVLKVYDQIKKCGNEFDYVYINDASKDNTLKILQENGLNHVNLISNLGIGGAVQTGYKYAYENGYDIAVQFDGDGQHDINYVKSICEPIINGQADMCIGSRYIKGHESQFQSTFMRRFGKNIISLMIKICCRQTITDPTSGFRAINKEIIELFAKDYPVEYPEPESLVTLIKKGYKVIEKPVSMNERQGGKSSIHAWKSVSYMVKVSIAIIINSIRSKNEKK